MNDKNATAYRQYKNAKLPKEKTTLLLPVLAHITRDRYNTCHHRLLNCFVRIIILETKSLAIKSNKGKKSSLDKTSIGPFHKITMKWDLNKTGICSLLNGTVAMYVLWVHVQS